MDLPLFETIVRIPEGPALPSVMECMAGGSRNFVKPGHAGKAIVSRVIGLWDNDRKVNITVEQKEFFEDVPAVAVIVSIFNFSGDGGDNLHRA